MTKLLITPQQTVQAAFKDAGASATPIAEEYITDIAIKAAQRRYIYPVLGMELYDAVADGKYETLLNDYIHPALAMYIRAMVIPGLWAQTGRGGILRTSGQDMSPVTENEMLRLVRHSKSTAATLLDICIDHIESSPGDYPEYKSGRYKVGNIF